MLFKGLKLHITATFLGLLTIAILLCNMVTVMFWQKAMVRSEVEHARALLAMAVGQEAGYDVGGGDFNYRSLSEDCKENGGPCLNTVIFDGEKLLGNAYPELAAVMSASARESIQSQSGVVALKGSTWAVYSFAKKYAILAEPAFSDDNPVGSQVMVVELEPLYRGIRKDQETIFVYLLVNGLILTVLGLFRMIKRVVKPVERIVRLANTYRDEEHLFFTSENEQNEFSQLSMALNTMLMRIESDKKALNNSITRLEQINEELVRTQKEMVRAEKLASVGRLSAGLAHEIGNPIGIVQGYIELLQQDEVGAEDRSEFGGRALSELDRVNRLIRQLLNYAGSSPEKIAEVIIDDDLFSGVWEIVALEKGSCTFAIEKDIAPGLVVLGDRDGLRQVFLNGLLNAVDAVTAAGREDGLIRISASPMASGSDGVIDTILIQIIDNGNGIDPAEMEKVFDPFYSTKETGKGTGLGLFVSHEIVEAHKGKMWLENRRVGGVILNICLPMDNAVQSNE